MEDDKTLIYNISHCRICQNPENLDLMNTSATIEGGQDTYLDVLKFIFSDIIWVEDSLLSVACSICLKKVAEVAKFKRLCWKTNLQRETFKQGETFCPKDPKEEDSGEVYDGANIHSPSENDLPKTEQKEPPKPKRKSCETSRKATKTKKRKKSQLKEKRFKSKSTKFTCEICSERFDNSDNLARHVFKHNGVRNHICPVCGLKYITRSYLTSHMRYHSEESKYSCDVCNKKFKTSNNLKAHSVVHVDPQDYRHPCTECARKFQTAAALRVHLKRHNQVRNFPCDLCEKRFISRDEQLKHLTKHTNVKPFRCDLCSAEYTRNQYLNVHKKNEHGDQKKPKMKKQYNCLYCEKSMDFKDKAKHFVRVHADIKPYQCRRCDAKFILKTYAKLHLRKVHDICINMRQGFEEYVLFQVPQRIEAKSGECE